MKNTFIYILISFIAFSCAQVVMPTGGKTDKDAPILIFTEPHNQTKNFKGKTFTLTFNELIDASSIYSDLIIIPDAGNPYETKIKNNSITLKFDKDFEDNTTYTFNFRNAIKDLTEKNPVKNLKFVISTGNTIDSLKISGKVLDINTKQPKMNVTVGLYPKDTLELIKKRPYYFIKTDSNGTFELENLKNNKYFLLAFTDKNNNLRYDEKEESMAFLSDSLILTNNLVIPDLFVYPSNRSVNKIKRVLPREKELTILLDKNIMDFKVAYKDSIDSSQLLYKSETNNIKFYKLSAALPDTVYTQIIVTDSLLSNDTLNTKIYFREETNRKTKIKPLNISSDIKNNTPITSNLNYNFYFDTPIIRFDSSKVVFKTDTLEKEKLSINKISPFHFRMSLKTKAEKEVELYIPSNTFENYLGDTSNTINLKNTILSNDELGVLEGTTIDDSTNKIAVLYSNKQEVAKMNFKSSFKFENLIPKNYEVKVIFDSNSNGIWDPGNLKTFEQPELLLSTREPIRIRANFEIKIKIE